METTTRNILWAMPTNGNGLRLPAGIVASWTIERMDDGRLYVRYWGGRTNARANAYSDVYINARTPKLPAPMREEYIADACKDIKAPARVIAALNEICSA